MRDRRRALLPSVPLVAILWLFTAVMRAEDARSWQAAAATPPASEAGADIAEVRCLTCHGPELMTQQRLSRDGWSRELDKMIGWGATVTAAERPILLDYLAARFGTVSQPAPSDGAGEALLKARCEACHGRALIDQQRLTAEGWAREIDKMAGWGAVISDSEKQALIAYLARRGEGAGSSRRR